MQPKLLRRPQLPVSEVRPNLDQRASCSIARRDEHLVVEDDRAGGIDGLVRAAAPWKGKIDATVRRIDRHQSAARRIRLASGKHEDAPLSVDHCGNRRGVARPPLLAGPPDFASGRLVEPDDARTARRADIHDQQLAFNQGRRRRPEKILRDAILLVQVALPDQLSRLPGRGNAAALARPPCTRARRR